MILMMGQGSLVRNRSDAATSDQAWKELSAAEMRNSGLHGPDRGAAGPPGAFSLAEAAGMVE
jgi:hypothetical protein